MALRQILKSLCFRSGWCYAVFWKLKRRNRMVLTWEDGFYENQSLGIEDPSCSEGNPLKQGASVHEPNNSGQIELCLAKMSYCVYFMGEGVIGCVASTGKHQWIIADGDSARKSSTIAISSQCTLDKYPSSWDVQFAAGIKTIAVIPVSQGVVQLGSAHMMKENMDWVKYVKSSFGSAQGARLSHMFLEGHGEMTHTNTLEMLGTTHGMVGTLDHSQPLWVAADIQPTELQSVGYGIHKSPGSLKCASDLQGVTETFPDMFQCTEMGMENKVVGGVLTSSEAISSSATLDKVSAINKPTHLQTGLDSEACFSEEENQTIPENKSLDFDSKSFVQRPAVVGFPQVSAETSTHFNFNSGANPNTSERFEKHDKSKVVLGRTTGINEYLVGSMLGNVSEITHTGNKCLNLLNKNTSPRSESARNSSFNPYNSENRQWDCTFAIGDELSQVLGPAFRKRKALEENTNGDQIIQKKVSVQIDGSDVASRWGTVFAEDSLPFLENKAEPLLDAVVANASSSQHSISTNIGESLSCRTFSGIDREMAAVNSDMQSNLENQTNASFQDCLSQRYIHSKPIDCEASADIHSLKKIIEEHLSFNTSCSGSPLKSLINSWPEDMQSMKSDSTHASYSKKPEEVPKATRKRARPGESNRPRPKDRQQIQDRVRELREIVPNGSKCSIDALLEKTIKHMLFLQNVTLHADILKKTGELKDDMDNGTSWAFELGSEEAGYPILVKNLSQPRQLLVEMFCEEKGHVLEIADVIRSLGLAILKGVMESRPDKIWARFVVEANKDVDRVEIMMSLIHLLHGNNHNSTSSMTMASQSVLFRSPHTADSSSSQTQSIHGLKQTSLHA